MDGIREGTGRRTGAEHREACETAESVGAPVYSLSATISCSRTWSTSRSRCVSAFALSCHPISAKLSFIFSSMRSMNSCTGTFSRGPSWLPLWSVPFVRSGARSVSTTCSHSLRGVVWLPPATDQREQVRVRECQNVPKSSVSACQRAEGGAHRSSRT